MPRTFDMPGAHLGDLLMALPAMRAEDTVVTSRPERLAGLSWPTRVAFDPPAGAQPVEPAALDPSRHATERWLQATGRKPRNHLGSAKVDRHWLVLAPAVDNLRKQWPAEHWNVLYERLSLHYGARVIYAGASREAWRQALQYAHTVVCPDTGTAHLADALGVPRVIALHGMGQTHFERYHPYWTRGQHCIVRDTMEEITPALVEDMIHGEFAR